MKNIITIFIIFLFSVQLFASGGSLYSKYGLGDVRYSFSSSRFGLGESGVALADKFSLSYNNPASWYTLPITRFEFGADATGLSFENSNDKTFNSTAGFTGFLMGFPLERTLGLTMVMGLVPFSKVGYESMEESKINIPGLDITDGLSRFKGNGSISSAFLGLSYKLPVDIVLGASLDYYFGTINTESFLDLEGSSIVTGSAFKQSSNYTGLGGTIGILSPDISKFINISKLKDFRIGLVYKLNTTLDVDTNVIKVTSFGDVNAFRGNSTVELPQRLSVGLSFNYDRDYTLAIDYVNQQWSNFKNNLDDNLILGDMNRYSLGFEFENRDADINSFWEQIVYRGGLSFEQSQLRINGEDINQYSVYSGISFPFNPISSLNFGFQLGMRGTTKSNLLKEKFIRVNVGVSFGSFWFVRQER